MSHLVLVRHGESRWNAGNKFTGWVDVPLSANGIDEARSCAEKCKKYDFDVAFTSRLERAHSTLLIILSLQDRTGIFQHKHDSRHYRWTCDSNRCMPDDLPIYESEMLNERYYGRLQGMNKHDAERKYGKERVLHWRRGYETRPPGGESLKETFERTLPYFNKTVLPKLKDGENVLIVGHGNTLRAIVKSLEKISDRDIAFLDLPEGEPLVYSYARAKFKRIKGEHRFGRPLR